MDDTPVDLKVALWVARDGLSLVHIYQLVINQVSIERTARHHLDLLLVIQLCELDTLILFD